MATHSLQSLTQPARLRALAARTSQWLPSVLGLVLLLLFAWLLAELVWALVPTPSSSAWRPAPAVPQKAAAQHRLDTAAITDAALFGRYQAPADPTVTALATAPETQLNLNLHGILANRTVPQDSRAVISHGGGDEKPYALGQAISKGVLLKAIFPDRVVLSRSGRLETLRLNRKAAGTAQPSNVPIAVAQTPGGNPAKLSKIRSALLANPGKAGNFIRVQPVGGGGGKPQLGYRIYPGPNRAAFTASGLHPGDLVTAVNGVPLTNPGRTLQLLSELSRARQVTLTIKRGKQTQTVPLNFAP